MRTDETILRDVLRLFVWFPIRWIAGSIPISSSLLVFKIMGDVHYHLSRVKCKKIERNMLSFLKTGKAAARSAAKKYFENHYLDRLHIFLYPKMKSRKVIDRYVRFENTEVLENVLKKKRGVLIVQPHFGPVQITLLSLALHGYNPIQIGYPRDLGLSRIGRSVAFNYRLKYEAMLPPILSADKFLGKAYKHLIAGGVVFTTGDGAGGGVLLGEHKECRFFDSRRMVPLGPAALAIKTGAALIPVFIINENYKTFRIVFEPAIEGIYGDIEKDKVYMAERFIAITEKYIRNYPHCWHFWDEVQE